MSETPEDAAILGQPVLAEPVISEPSPGPVLGDRQPPAGEGYDLQQVYAEKMRPFWFRWADRWWELPHLRMLDFEVQGQVADFDFSILATSDSDALEEAKTKLNQLFDLLMGPELAGEWRKVPRPLEVLLDMVQRWSKHSGTDVGESSASDDSSGSTGRPSKPTSTGSTASGSRKRSPAPRKAPAKKAAKAVTRRGSS